MITETELSVKSAKDVSRKEKVKESDSRFQDIFTALTSALQTANPQAANNASNGVVQKSGNNTGNAVRETEQKSGLSQKDVAQKNRLDKNNSKKTDKSFSENSKNAQEDLKTNKKSTEKNRSTAGVQTSKKEPAPLKNISNKSVADNKPQSGSNGESLAVSEDSQDISLGEKGINEPKDLVDNADEPGLSELDKAQAELDLPNDISKTQDLSQDIIAPQQFLSMLNDQGSKIEDLLAQAGVSETDAKSLLNGQGSKIEDLLAQAGVSETDAKSLLNGQGSKIEDLLAQAGASETDAKSLLGKTEALGGALQNIKSKTSSETTATFEGNEADTDGISSLDEAKSISADNFVKNLQNSKSKIDAVDKTDILEKFSSKSEGKKSDAGISLAVNKESEASLPTLSSNQEYNANSFQISNFQDKDANAQNSLKGSKDISEMTTSVSETVKAGSNVSAHNITADTSAKFTNEIKQIFSQQEAINRGINEKPVVNQIIEKFSLRGTNGQQNEINIKLEPPDLGTVRVNIISEGDNVKATLITENHAVKQIIESNLGQLRDSMSDQGLKVQSFTVLVGGGNQGQKGQNYQPQQGANNTQGAPFQENSNRQDNGENVLSGRKRFYDKSQSISIFA